ncbi:hypothetical protein DICVIV_08421 [Dictyocaulus viviparus]|uniref:Guanylate kinase-like domain-containing protein n=1 Tax=Dictyocaulus viviparus TaxID=29172 RepID=A0A0D8XLM4_DICVI|nr:hypothetical protein DICVIV_08421 [Dictyocaulus viviparus]
MVTGIGFSAFSRIGLIPSEALQLQKNTSEIEQKSDGRGSSRSGSSHEVDLVYEPVCRMSFQDGFSRIIVLVGSPGVGRYITIANHFTLLFL